MTERSVTPGCQPAALIEERFIAVYPSLIRALGGHALAVVAQAVHFRSQVGERFEGHMWAVATRDEWCNDVVMTEDQLRRAFRALTDMGVLINAQPGRFDRTTWRRIDRDRLASLVSDAQMHSGENPAMMVGETTRSDGGENHAIILYEEVEEGNQEEECSRGGDSAPMQLPIESMPQVPTFDDFWQVWPRKVAKAKARSAWNTMKRRERVAAMEALPDHIAHVFTDPQFTPYPASWLNAKRWEDDLSSFTAPARRPLNRAQQALARSMESRINGRPNRFAEMNQQDREQGQVGQ